jgi:dTDP-4-dehydrorhamnose 3,5-epimerase
VVFRETPVAGAWVIDPEPSADERGSFARVFDAELFAAHGLSPGVVQCSVSLNTRSGTLRGLHYQADPHAESKLVRCTAGSVYDVVVDLRPHSSSYLRWHAVELSSENRRSLYLPAGTAHGFQTLVDGAELTYMMDAPFVVEAARGVRWDDPAFAIEWPSPSAERTISERDRSYPDYRAT